VTYDNNMSGVLFKNDKKGNDKRPDYRGTAVIDGVDLNISAWIKASQKTGDKFMSLRFEPKQGAPKKATRAPVMDETPFKFDDADLPF
jgi:uncharacterized protein (DUF736 family)